MNSTLDHQKEIEAARFKGLTAGIALCAGELNRWHGEKTLASELLSNAGIRSRQELRDCGVDEYDILCIGNLLPEVYK